MRCRCQQTVPCAKRTENAAQQSNLFAAFNAICWACGKLCSVCRFFCYVVSCILKAFWPSISLFWLTITAIPHFSLRHLESQTTCDRFLATSRSASVKRKLSDTVAKLSEVAPTKPGPTKFPLEVLGATNIELCFKFNKKNHFTRLICSGWRAAQWIPRRPIQAHPSQDIAAQE